MNRAKKILNRSLLLDLESMIPAATRMLKGEATSPEFSAMRCALDAENEDAKLSVLAVGDYDQNVYTFRGANIRFIRQFEQNYDARITWLKIIDPQQISSTPPTIQAGLDAISAAGRDPDQVFADRMPQFPKSKPGEIVDCLLNLNELFAIESSSRKGGRS